MYVVSTVTFRVGDFGSYETYTKKILGVLFFNMTVCSSCFSAIVSYNNGDFQKVSDVICDAVLDIRYYSSNNFTGKKIRGYNAPVPYLTKKALNALVVAANDLRQQGYRLLIWDAYRPQKAVDHFVEWINDPKDPGDKSFYPNIEKSNLISGGYIAPKSGHSRGSTIDLTIVKKDGSSVDMGGTFDLFDKRSNRNYERLTEAQKNNRKILENAMIKVGFIGADSEWWHYTYKDEDYKNTYFDFDIGYDLK